MSLLISGVIAFDQVETPFGKSEKMIGGPAFYAAIAASYFPIEVDIVAKVGYDFSPIHFETLTKKGINTANISQSKDQKSFFWAAKYHHDMNSRDTLITELNVYENYQPVIHTDIQPNVVLLANDHPNNQLAILQQLKRSPQLVVMDTMNYWMDNTWEELHGALQVIDVLTINDAEARQLSGEYSLVKAARKILTLGPKYLIIKKGEHGAFLFHENEMFFAPALPLEQVFDPTGAGDTFAGGFCGYLAQTNDFNFNNIKRAIMYGSALASFCIEQFGAEQMYSLTDKELTSRLNEFRRLVHYDLF